MLKKAHGHGGFGGAGGRFLFQSGRLGGGDKPADSPATIRQVAGGRFRFISGSGPEFDIHACECRGGERVGVARIPVHTEFNDNDVFRGRHP